MQINIPYVGDLVYCSDGDLGIVLETFEDCGLHMRVRWNKESRVCEDIWDCKQYDTLEPLFSIVSKAND